MPRLLNRICCCLVGDLPKSIKYFLRSLLIFTCIINDDDVVCYCCIKDEHYPIENECCKINDSVQLGCLICWTCNNIHCCDYTCYFLREGKYLQCILGAIISIPVEMIQCILVLVLILLVFDIISLVLAIILFIPFICFMIVFMCIEMLQETL